MKLIEFLVIKHKWKFMVSQVVDFSQNTLNMSIIANVISIKLLLQI